MFFFFFFFNDTATTEIYTLSLHDALPIFQHLEQFLEQRPATPGVNHLLVLPQAGRMQGGAPWLRLSEVDRKSTRLNSSHLVISYAVFCLKKKKNTSRAPYRLRDTSVDTSA